MALNVPAEFLLPVGDSTPWGVRVLAAGMLVPEATMDEDHRSVPGKHNVRRPGEISDVQPKPVSASVEQRTDRLLRLAIPGTNSGHVPASLFLRDSIRHAPPASPSGIYLLWGKRGFHGKRTSALSRRNGPSSQPLKNPSGEFFLGWRVLIQHIHHQAAVARTHSAVQSQSVRSSRPGRLSVVIQ